MGIHPKLHPFISKFFVPAGLDEYKAAIMLFSCIEHSVMSVYSVHANLHT